MAYTIGFIGLGKMGNPMCRRLSGRGHALVVHDIAPQALAAVAGLQPVVAASPAEVAAKADVEINSKDVDIACALAQELHVPLFLGSVVQNVLRSIRMETGPDADFLSFVPKYERWSGVDLPNK